MNTVGFETLWLLSKAVCLFHLQIIQDFAKIPIFFILPTLLFSFQNRNLFFWWPDETSIQKAGTCLESHSKTARNYICLVVPHINLPYLTWRVSFVPKEKKLQHMKYKEHLNTSFQCLVSCLHANIKYILSCVEPQTRRVATIFQTESMSSEHCLAIGLAFTLICESLTSTFKFLLPQFSLCSKFQV